jgi:pimeloyl-ACP methyl ester carboxylesterase
MSIHQRNNIHIEGSGTKTMLLAHGFGCDQAMWRFVVPAFVNDHRVVLFDHVGAGKSDTTQYRARSTAPLKATPTMCLKSSMRSAALRYFSSGIRQRDDRGACGSETPRQASSG